MAILSKQEEEKVLQGTHCFSGINYQMKPSSTSHAIRLVTNSSAYHRNGSLNSHLPKGASLIANLKHIFTKWRLGTYCVLMDLARAYRSIYTDHPTNLLRLMWWVTSIADAQGNYERSQCILKLLRVTYGDQCSAAILEICLRTLVAPLCRTELGRKFLSEHRYVDDILPSYDDLPELMDAIDDVIVTLAKFGFSVKHICSTKLIYQV